MFEGRRQLFVYFHMWHDGQAAADQCEGCTFFNGQVRELAYFHSRDATYATFCQGPLRGKRGYRDFIGWDGPWYSARDSADALLVGRWFGMQVCYLRDGDRVFETYWTSGRAAEVDGSGHPLLDMTVYGRQEDWEDSPAGWPQPFATNARPVPYRRSAHRPVVSPGRGPFRRASGSRPVSSWPARTSPAIRRTSAGRAGPGQRAAGRRGRAGAGRRARRMDRDHHAARPVMGMSSRTRAGSPWTSGAGQLQGPGPRLGRRPA